MSVEDGKNDFAYQATMKIEGYIFKGLMYNLGLHLVQQAVMTNPSKL
jgi:hypothetical protein